jgi:hypothetical protein
MAGETVKLICPNLRCRALLSVPAVARGKIVRCRQCGTRVKVPLTAKVKREEAPAVARQPQDQDETAAEPKQPTSAD